MTDLNIAAPLAAALAAKGYENLTPVQLAVIAPELGGRDALVSAQTGSGKTVAFGLAMAPEVLNGADRLLFADTPLALIIAPTRELAQQVAAELTWLYHEAGASIATCVGGMDYRTERRTLERGAHIVVGTPGRLRDHIERGSLNLGNLKVVILDEADEMLDMGFAEDLEFILSNAPEERRTLMFSATVPKEIAHLAKSFQRDAIRIQTAGEQKQHRDIEYLGYNVSSRDKEHAIFNILRFYEARTAIVFCKTRTAVNHLLARMGNRGLQVVALSGELSQSERMHALQALRDGRARVCVATDVAARGIDLPGLELVIHADLPSNSETLLHRSGRTGRAGKKGVSALITPPAELRKAQRLLQGAKITAQWGKAPNADDVQARDDIRLQEHSSLSEDMADEAALAQTLLDRYGPAQIAGAFIKLWRGARSAPEVLHDHLPVPSAPSAPRERGEFGESVWFSLPVGHEDRAEARWLLPKICDAGSITKSEIGAIRVQKNCTYVQIAKAVAGRFDETTQLDSDLMMTRLAGEPSLARPERPSAPRKSSGARTERPYSDKPKTFDKPKGDRPKGDWAKSEKPKGKSDTPRPPRGDKPAYQPKPARFIDDDAPAPARKTYAKSQGADAKPYAKRDEPRADAPKKARERTDYQAGDDKPAKRGDKPFGAKPRASDGKDSYGKDKGKPRSAGFKSHGAGTEKPTRASGFKSHGSEGGKPAGAKYGKPKPAAPRAGASDTSKRFTPPKKK